MRILTVRQPWAWAIIHGGKNVENRTRNIAGTYRGPVAIHVATACPLLDDDCKVSDLLGKPVRTMKDFQPIDGGHIIGVVDLVDVHRVIESAGRAHCEITEAPTDPAVSGACSIWAERDAHHLLLANPRTLAEPIRYRGALGLRELDADTVARIEAAIA
jgi:hypothetical protein